MKLFCSWLNCSLEAKWGIFCKKNKGIIHWDSCTEHVGDLLRDNTIHTVQPITIGEVQ